MAPDPYVWRLTVLLGILLLVAGVDLYRRPTGTRRWLDYAIPLLGGAIGAIVGWINDVFVTSPLSPDYFMLGKGIAGGEGFERRVAALGLQAGMGPGILTGALYAYVNLRRSEQPSLRTSQLALQLGKPLALAIATGILLPLLLGSWDPLGFRPVLTRAISVEGVRNFLRVWWIHVGVYLGTLLGLIWGATTIHRKRGRLPAPQAAAFGRVE
jgi:hypothetical protein